jgi:hypothetical protein
MAWFLCILTAFSLIMLWRDLKSGRIYFSYRHTKLEYDAPECFFERKSAPIIYRLILISVGVLCISNLIVGMLFFFGLAGRLNNTLLTSLLGPGIIVPVIYLGQGVLGRFFSWVKNYGSIDKQW